MAKPKNIDDISMSFANPPEPPTEPAAPTAAEDVEELKDNGKLVYRKNKKTGDIKFYDGDEKEVSIDVIDKLEKAYQPIPERNYQGAKKKGESKIRFVKEQFNEEKLQTETVECPESECEIISERQDYEQGDVVTNSISKKHYSLVKMLRGEISG